MSIKTRLGKLEEKAKPQGDPLVIVLVYVDGLTGEEKPHKRYTYDRGELVRIESLDGIESHHEPI
jgi:hypothetical protein